GIVDLKPYVSVVLKISEDQIERHSEIEVYAAAKARVMENQGEEDFVVLNFDDPWVRRMARGARAKTLFFSCYHILPEGAFLVDDVLVVRFGDEEAEFGRVCELPLIGRHNVENVMASVLAARVLGVPWEMIHQGVNNFRGLDHRLERVGQIHGVTFVNDSKATNVAACIAALRSFPSDGLILVLGGDDKGLDYKPLASEVIKRVKHVIFLGDGLARVRGEFADAGVTQVSVVDSMDEVVGESLRVAAAGDVVLLSPSSSSFDRYKNFEERGIDFKNAVNKFKG
ncbi:MAG: UDP-N-acetylmuramoyl-L-alanine--D-glutamate ligase, partial [bacterium]